MGMFNRVRLVCVNCGYDCQGEVDSTGKITQSDNNDMWKKLKTLTFCSAYCYTEWGNFHRKKMELDL
jgi:hypothetical protein